MKALIFPCGKDNHILIVESRLHYLFKFKYFFQAPGQNTASFPFLSSFLSDLRQTLLGLNKCLQLFI